MLTKLGAWWIWVRESLWSLPTLLTALAVALAAATLWLDGLLQRNPRVDYLAFAGGAEGARGVLSAIAASLITVTGVVFSITIVALQLASSQFTPRVLRHFTGDRANQLVLGVLIGTFTYTLLVLRTVRADGRDVGTFVPALSVGLAVVLALVSIGFLIFYIHHAARSIQAAVIIERAAHDTLTLIRRSCPEGPAEPAEGSPCPVLPETEGAPICSPHAGYLQAVDLDGLAELAGQAGVTIRMELSVGEFVLPGARLASVWPASVSDEVRDDICQAFVLGPERTLQQDVAFGLRQLADIAIRALSPAVNDPTTATMCIDRLAELLVTLGTRESPEQVRVDEKGRVCLVARPLRFERAVELSFAQIRHYGTGDAVVARYLLETLGRIAALVPGDRRGPLARQMGLVRQAARERIGQPADLAEVEAIGDWALAQLTSDIDPPGAADRSPE